MSFQGLQGSHKNFFWVQILKKPLKGVLSFLFLLLIFQILLTILYIYLCKNNNRPKNSNPNKMTEGKIQQIKTAYENLFLSTY